MVKFLNTFEMFFFIRLFFFIGSFMLFSCGVPVEKQAAITLHDSIYCDSISFSGHSYVCFRSNVFHTIEHSPDCSCRYNRTFIVIKRSK